MSCGHHCQCAGKESKPANAVCEIPNEKIVLDKDGKCPCGKTEADCCQNVKAKQGSQNDAIAELCGTDKNIC
jgi:hypothetical protein